MTTHITWKEIKLSKGKVTLIDNDDFEKVNKYKWTFDGRYAERTIWHTKEKIYLHRFILGIELNDKRSVDHINHNSLDNRKSNLRICTHAENLRNMKLRVDSTTGYRGVHKPDKWSKRFRAVIMYDYKHIHHQLTFRL